MNSTALKHKYFMYSILLCLEDRLSVYVSCFRQELRNDINIITNVRINKKLDSRNVRNYFKSIP